MEQKLITRSLRILRLFCEGHYLELQNYIRYQTNQKNSYDLVSYTVQLLCSLRVSNQNYELVTQSFETLTGLIQGPCKQNQLAISNSKFLEYAVQVLGEDDKIFELRAAMTAKERKRMKEEGRKDRGQLADQSQPYMLNIHPGRLGRLKFKCLNTIISLLECSDTQDNLILWIIRSIPLSVLTNNLRRIYQLFERFEKEEYREELFKRYEKDIEEGGQAKEEEYYELIIENGFYIYLLMQYFLSNKKAKAMLYEDQEMNDVLNEFGDQKDGNEIEGLLKNNILGEFSKLGG